MIQSKWIGALAALLMALAVLLTGIAGLAPAAVASLTSSAEPAYVTAMDKTALLDVQIIADEQAWTEMLENATAETYIPATVVINGTKIENVGIRPKGNSSLSMVAQDETTDRFSFKIEFDHYIEGQTWLGLDKLVVNNMQGDASYMKEYLSYDIMAYVGVETPQYAFADISVNGETWGLYLAVEALEDSFVQRVYGKSHGSLYKPENMSMGDGGMGDKTREPGEEGMAPPSWDGARPQRPEGQQVDGSLPDGALPDDSLSEGKLPNVSFSEGEMPDFPFSEGEMPEFSFPEGGMPDGGGGGQGGMGGGMAANGVSLEYMGDQIESYTAIFENSVFDATKKDYRRVISALEKLSKGEDLEEAVDVEAVLKYFAAHSFVVNLDSYSSNMGHNYYLYEEDGRLSILPWDYNLAFGGFQSGDASGVVNFPIDTPLSGVSLEERPLLGKLLEVPEYLEQYHAYLRQIVDGYFNAGLFSQAVEDLNSLIAPYVEADPTAFYTYEAYQKAVEELKELGRLRAESVEGQLNGSIPSTSEGQSADPDRLIDASGIDLSALGSQGGGRGQGGFGKGNSTLYSP